MQIIMLKYTTTHETPIFNFIPSESTAGSGIFFFALEETLNKEKQQNTLEYDIITFKFLQLFKY